MNTLSPAPNITPLQQSAIDIRKVCDELADFLIKKNESYGNSALSPTRIMSKLDAVEGIKIRIDDKLNRIIQGKETFNEDTELDLTGYFILLRVVRRRAVKDEYLKTVAAADEPIGRTVPLFAPPNSTGPKATLQEGNQF